MTKLFVAAMALAFSGSALANYANEPTHKRIYGPKITCSAIQSKVARHGAVIVYSSSDIYDRYVAHAGYCPMGYDLTSGWVRASDTDQCPLLRCGGWQGGGG